MGDGNSTRIFSIVPIAPFWSKKCYPSAILTWTTLEILSDLKVNCTRAETYAIGKMCDVWGVTSREGDVCVGGDLYEAKYLAWGLKGN